jgi:hypothetical protein
VAYHYRKRTPPEPFKRALFGAAVGIGIVSAAVWKFEASPWWWLAVPAVAGLASLTRPYPPPPPTKFRRRYVENRPFLNACIGALWGLGMGYIAMKLDASPWWWSAVPIVAILASLTSGLRPVNLDGEGGDEYYGSDSGDSGSSDSGSSDSSS